MEYMAKNGVDIIEIGVPFSDPMAEGPSIQRAHERSLKNNTSLEISDFEKIISKLGKLVHSRNHVANTDRTIQLVTEDEAFGDGDVEWHNDWSYGRGNYFGTALYNKANGKKSTTDFVDMKDAYDRYEDKESLDLLLSKQNSLSKLEISHSTDLSPWSLGPKFQDSE